MCFNSLFLFDNSVICCKFLHAYVIFYYLNAGFCIWICRRCMYCWQLCVKWQKARESWWRSVLIHSSSSVLNRQVNIKCNKSDTLSAFPRSFNTRLFFFLIVCLVVYDGSSGLGIKLISPSCSLESKLWRPTHHNGHRRGQKEGVELFLCSNLILLSICNGDSPGELVLGVCALM